MVHTTLNSALYLCQWRTASKNWRKQGLVIVVLEVDTGWVHAEPCPRGRGSHIPQPCKTGGVKIPEVQKPLPVIPLSNPPNHPSWNHAAHSYVPSTQSQVPPLSQPAQAAVMSSARNADIKTAGVIRTVCSYWEWGCKSSLWHWGNFYDDVISVGCKRAEGSYWKTPFADWGCAGRRIWCCWGDCERSKPCKYLHLSSDSNGWVVWCLLEGGAWNLSSSSRSCWWFSSLCWSHRSWHRRYWHCVWRRLLWYHSTRYDVEIEEWSQRNTNNVRTDSSWWMDSSWMDSSWLTRVTKTVIQLIRMQWWDNTPVNVR